MADFRELCRELVEQLDDALDFTVSSETRKHMKRLTTRARAALAAAPESPPLSLTDLVSAVAAAVTPSGGYEPGRGLMDGSQLVNDEWWEPEFGCDSLEQTLSGIRGRLVTAITDWQRAAIAADRARAAPLAAEGESHWSEGICGDGAAILRDGVMVPIEEVIAELNRRAAPVALTVPREVLEAARIELNPAGRNGSMVLGFLERLSCSAATAAPAMAEGEVEELAGLLDLFASTFSADGLPNAGKACLDAAALLRSLAARPAVVPVAVSERLPGPGDCDAEGRVWGWETISEQWGLWPRQSAGQGFHLWLPAHAIPEPADAGEVE